MERSHLIDDPVGAISVHLVCVVWGTLTVGLFGVGPDVYPWYGPGTGPLTGLLLSGDLQQLFTHLIRIIAIGGFTILFILVVWMILKYPIGIRVLPNQELMGLDLSEHGMEAYSGFLESRK